MVVLLLAASNLMTLGIVVGSGSSVYAGWCIFDMDVFGFCGATLVGVIIVVVLVIVLEILFVGWCCCWCEFIYLWVEKKIRDV